MQPSADLSLRQVEEDIRLCEDYLAADDARTWQPPQQTKQRKTGMDGSTVQPRIDPARRQEILERLAKEREERRKQVEASARGGTHEATEPDEESHPVQSLPASGLGRELLLQRLNEHKAKKEAEVETMDELEMDNEQPRIAPAPYTPQLRRSQQPHGNDCGEAPPPLIQHSTAPTPTPKTKPRSGAKMATPSSARKPEYAVPGTARRTKATPKAKAAPKPKAAAKPKPKPKRYAAPPSCASTDRGIPNKHSKEEVMRKLKEQEEKNCTFKPKIKKLPKDTQYNYSNKMAQMTQAERMERLAESRSNAWAKREKIKVSQEADEMSQCTFKPTINANARRTRNNLPLEERLHHEADDKHAARERLKRDLDEQAVQNCTFQPAINSATPFIDLSNYRPLHERVGQLQREKNEKLHKMRLEQEELDPNLTFNPRIGERTYDLLRGRFDDSDVGERLTRDAALQVEKKMRRKEDMDKELAEKYPFQPQMDPNSERIVADNSIFGEDFLTRQEAFEERKKNILRYEQEVFQPSYSFKPEIGNATQVLLQARNPIARESKEEMVERLAYKDKQKTETLRDAVSSEYYGQYTFKPNINSVSKQIGRAMTVEELHNNSRNQEVKRRAQQHAEEELKAKCTFKPQLATKRPDGQPNHDFNAKKTIDLSDPDKVIDNIEQYRKAKEMKLEQTRRELEYDEMKGCTFNPEITRSKPKEPKGPMVIRGFGRYLELRELAKKKEHDKKEREDKAFMVNVPDREGFYTVPKPFNLHSDKGAASRMERVRQEAEESEMKECTFKPKTNEMTNRELIARILSDAV